MSVISQSNNLQPERVVLTIETCNNGIYERKLIKISKQEFEELIKEV